MPIHYLARSVIQPDNAENSVEWRSVSYSRRFAQSIDRRFEIPTCLFAGDVQFPARYTSPRGHDSIRQALTVLQIPSVNCRNSIIPQFGGWWTDTTPCRRFKVGLELPSAHPQIRELIARKKKDYSCYN